jgi:tetratricopeptide (TPR) repeat protein
VALVALVIAYWRGRAGTDMRLTRLDHVFIGSTAAAAFGVVVGSSLRPDAVRNVLTRVASIFQFGEGSALTRFQIWQAALASIAERPVFGWGADTFRLLFPRFKPAEYVEAAGYLSVADNVHNYPLQLASGIGVPGALMLYGLVGWTLSVGARDVFAKGKGSERLLQAGFWAAVLGYAVHLLFGLSVTGSTVFLWMSIGVLLSPGAGVRQVATPSWRVVALPVVAGLVLLGTVMNVRYVVADNHYLVGRVIARDADAADRIERAIALNPFNEMYKLELGSVWHTRFRAAAERYAAAWAAGSGAEPDRALALDYLATAEDAYLAVIDYAPMEYDTYVFLANLYNEAAIYIDPAYAADAVEVGMRGVAVSEFGPAIRVQLALAYSVQERFDEAIAELEFATALDSRYTGAYTLLGDMYARAGRVDDARAAYEHVLKRYPDDAGARAGLEALEATDGATGDVD